MHNIESTQTVDLSTTGHGSVPRLTPEYKLRTVDESEFKAKQSDWNRLLDQSRSTSFFLKWQWLYTYWLSIKNQNTRLSILVIESQEELVAIAPLYAIRTSGFTRAVWSMKFLGQDVASDYLDFIIHPDHEEACLKLFLDELFGSGAQATVMSFAGFAQNSIFYQILIPELSKRHHSFICYKDNGCPEIILPENETEFSRQLSSNTRYNLKRREKQLRKNYDRVEFEFVEFNRNEHMVNTLFRLHEMRWNSIEHKTSTFNNDFRKKFFKTFNALAKNEDGLYSFVKIDEKIVSAILLFHFQGHYFFYQNGWDPDFSRFSIGIVHLYYVIQYCIEKNGVNFSLLRGDEAYKFKFTDRTMPQYSILIYQNSLLGRTMYWGKKGLLFAKKSIKRIFKISTSF